MASRANSISVFLKLHGQRKFEREVAHAGVELEAMGLKGAKSMASFAATSKKLKSFGSTMTRNVTLPMIGLGVVSGKFASDFDRQASLISTQAGGSAREVGVLKKQVQEFAKESQYGPTELMKGLFYIESAGLRGSKAMQMLRANVKLATVGNADLEHTVFGTVGAMNALGKEGRNFNRIAAIMNATVGHGHMRMEDMVGAISTGLPAAAKSFGLSLKGMNSAVAFFTRVGEPAQQAATRLRQTITHLATASTNKAQEALESIGMSPARMGASIRRARSLGPVIKELAEHLRRISKTRANQILTDAFGGGRFGTQIREATQQIGLFLRTEREIGKSGTVKELNRAFGEANAQPAVKLKEAWSSMQDALISIGNDLLPVATPALEKLAHIASHLTAAFTALPGPLQAATIGFLVLTGPVASGLGYFAGGLGRILILTTKVGKAVQAFSVTMQEAGYVSKLTLATAGGAAWEELGMGGAVQAAKGFAWALGPAIAAYGIGNIATSAMSHNWRDAGFEAGGAVVGGIAGAMLGGPLGAMFGVGAGSLGGELLSGLFDSGKKLPPLQNKLAASAKGLRTALEAQRTASRNLASATAGLVRAHHRQGAAAQEVKTAEHALAAARSQFGANSLQAIRAEVHLARAGERRAAAIRAVKRAERLHGVEKGIAKEALSYAELQARHRILLLKGRQSHLLQQRRERKLAGDSVQQLHQLNERLQKVRENLIGARGKQATIFQEGAKEIGPKFANFLRKASHRALEFGGSLKAVRTEALNTTKSLERFAETARGALEEVPGLKHQMYLERHPRSRRPHGRHRHRPAHGARGAQNRRRSSIATPRHRPVLPIAAIAGAKPPDTVVHTTIALDGKVLAKAVTRQAAHSAAHE